MFWPFGKFNSPQSFLGVDIGTTSIKVVELIKRGNQIELLNYALLETIGHLERVNTAIQTSTLKLFEQEAINLLRLLLKRGKFESRQIAASLPAFSVFTTTLEIPPMPEEEINRTLPFKARQYIPMPVASVALDWVRTGDNQILLMAIPNEQIGRYQKIFGEAGLKVGAMELEGMSLARALSADNPELILIVDIGSRSTGLFLAQNGLLKAVAQTDFAGASLTRTIAAGLGVNVRRAEDLKRQRGLIDLGFGPEQELSTLMKPVLDVIINEAGRVHSGEVKAVTLVGGGVALPGIEDYFAERLNLPVSKADPFANLVLPAKAAALLKPLGPSLAVAVGVALRALWSPQP